MARHACIALARMAPLLMAATGEEHARQMRLLRVRLARLLVAPPGAGLGAAWGSEWYSAAQVHHMCVCVLWPWCGWPA